MERVIKHLDDHCTCKPHEVITTLVDAATKWTGNDEPTDDQTIVVVKKA